MTAPRHSRYGYRPRALARTGRLLPGALLLGGGGLLGVALLLAAWIGPDREASGSLAVPEAPDVIWQVLTDLDNLPTWRTGLTRVERLPDLGGTPAWMEFRGTRQEAVRVAEAERPLRLVTERVGPDGVTASWNWELVRTGEGSRLTLTRRVTLIPLGQRVLSGVFRQTGREVEQALSDLSARLDGASRVRTTALHR
jgi:hypothetical protein